MRSRALPLLLAVTFVATACGLLPADLQHELLPSQTQYKTAEAAYSVLIERHVDKPTPQQLIPGALDGVAKYLRSEEHTSELQSRRDLVCRLLLEKKKKNGTKITSKTKQSKRRQ